ncbi:MAG TPA: hypothetical protein VIH22_08740 [Cyclobacteriaceae bacterium]|jgi:hypothetical protein
MDEKINLKAIARYSDEFADKMLGSYFEAKETISGQDILKFSELKQINLFILYELLTTWKNELSKARSPFFDYDAPDVKQAQEALMNALSNHIVISREHFSPLLRKATYNTLLLVIDPYDFFVEMIEGGHNELTPAGFKEHLRYVKINKAPLERLLQRLEENKVSAISGNEAFGMLDTILEEVNFTPEEIDEYLALFSRVVPVTIDMFFDVKLPQQHNDVLREDSGNLSHWQPVKSTVNDELAREPRPTIADNFKRITSIRESLTINQKFMFTKVLFHGDFELFSKAVDDLDRQDHINGALHYLEQNYEEWDRESEEFHEFMELLEKRFES